MSLGRSTVARRGGSRPSRVGDPQGLTPARPGREGFVVGSMGDESAILEGVESSEAEESLVLDAHAGSIRVMHTLRPLGVAMAGREVYDPYKD